MKRQISFYKKYNKIEGDEILKTIKVDILIGNIEYKDQFEWELIILKMNLKNLQEMYI